MANAKKKMKLAEALLLRKSLANKLARIEVIKERDELFEVKTERHMLGEGKIEEVKVSTPKLSFKDVLREYNDVAKQVRILDSAIQYANWQFDVELPADFEKE